MKNQIFPKFSSSEKNVLQKQHLLWKSSFSVDIFILNNSSSKRVAVSKWNFSKERPILKKWLLDISSHWNSSYSEKNNYCEEGILLLCRSSYSEEVRRSSFSENKAVLKKS